MGTEIRQGIPKRRLEIDSIIHCIGMKVDPDILAASVAIYDDDKLLIFQKNSEFPLIIDNPPETITSSWVGNLGIDKTDITDIKYASNTKVLAVSAFAGCTSLSAVKAPRECNLLSAYEHSFANCSALTRFEADFSKLTWASDLFSDCNISSISPLSVSDNYEELLNVLGFSLSSSSQTFSTSRKSLLGTSYGVDTDSKSTFWKTIWDDSLAKDVALNPDGSLKPRTPIHRHTTESEGQEIDPSEVCYTETIHHDAETVHHDAVEDNPYTDPYTDEDETSDEYDETVKEAYDEIIAHQHDFRSEEKTTESSVTGYCIGAVKTVTPLYNTPGDNIKLVIGYRISITYIISNSKSKSHIYASECSVCGRSFMTSKDDYDVEYTYNTVEQDVPATSTEFEDPTPPPSDFTPEEGSPVSYAECSWDEKGEVLEQNGSRTYNAPCQH